MKTAIKILVLGWCCLTGSTTFAAIVYGSGGNGDLYTINPLTGNETLIGAMGHVFFDIGFDTTNDTLYGISGDDLYTVNVSTGASILVGSTDVSGSVNINALSNSIGGTMYAASSQGQLYTINVTTGAATLIGGSGGWASSGDLEVDSSGNLYITSTTGTGGTDQLFEINPANGAGTAIGTSLGFADVYGLAEVNGVMYGFTNAGASDHVITVNLSTGVGTVGASYANAFDGTAVDPMPEPATLGLIGAGLMVLASFGKRKRAR